MRKIYWIDDGGYVWKYSAESEAQAKEMHLAMNYDGAGIPRSDAEIECGIVADDEELTITCTMPAREWAATRDGLVSSEFE